jgi:hypothetical protein
MSNPDLQRHVGKYYSKYSGLVATDPQPDAMGRIKVRVPSIFGETTEVRARPCMPFGHFYIPDPGAPIWVEFEAGDPAHAIWTGCWYATGTAPAETQGVEQAHRVIQMPSGHTIELSDEEGAEKVVIRHKDNAFIALLPDGSVIVSNKNGANLYLNAEGGQTTLTSEQGHMVTMTGDAIVVVNDAGSVFELKGDTVTVLATNVVVSGTSVALGANAAEPTIMGNAFSMLWTQLLTHVHPTAMGPTGPSPTLPALALMPGQHLTSSVVVK